MQRLSSTNIYFNSLIGNFNQSREQFFELSLPVFPVITKSILIVDDSPYNLFILKEILLTMENTDKGMIK